MNEAYSKYLKYLKHQDKILDLGCGSGRDSLYFLKNDFKVLSIDYSEEMVKKATELTNQKVIYLDMTKMNYENEFHGIWACASILHIPKLNVPEVLENCHKALKDKGIFYLSFKSKEIEEEFRNQRHFTNFSYESFLEILPKDLFKVKEYWISEDVRPERSDEKWLNIILKKRG